MKCDWIKIIQLSLWNGAAIWRKKDKKKMCHRRNSHGCVVENCIEKGQLVQLGLIITVQFDENDNKQRREREPIFHMHHIFTMMTTNG